jgi:hypothetical protein
MRPNIFARRSFVLSIITVTAAINTAAAQQIHNWPWKDKQKLSWNDFKLVNTCETAMPDGVMEWAMVNTYVSNSLEQDNKMRAATILKLDHTWICDNVVKDDTLLMYLQVSYDMAELATRKLNDIYKAAAAKKLSVEEISELSAISTEKVEQDFNERRTQFFSETKHGLDKAAILRWKQLVDKELKETKYTY